MLRKSTTLLLAIAIALPSIANAQGSTENKAAAEALFTEGKRLMDAGDYAKACKKLEASQKLDPAAGTLFNLAGCYEANGQTASAWITYKDVVVAAAQRHPDWAQQAQTQATALEPKLSKLTITVKMPTADVKVTRDGSPVEQTAWDVPIPVDPGEHTVEARAPGHKTFHTTVMLGESKDLKTVDVPALDVGEDPIPPAPGTTQRILGGTLIGVGGVGIVLGSVFGVVALGKKSDAGKECTPDYMVCSPAGKALVDDAKSNGLISTVAFIAGGAFAVGGLILILTAPHAAESKVTARFGAPGADLGFTLGGVF